MILRENLHSHPSYRMYRNLFITVLALVLMLKISECIVCIPDICAAIKCQDAEECNGVNQVMKKGGFCNCCNECHTILSENEACNSLSTILLGAPPPTSQCGEGLICHEGKCKNLKSLDKSVIGSTQPKNILKIRSNVS